MSSPGRITRHRTNFDGSRAPRDLNVLLVALDGTGFIVRADSGGLNAINGVNITLNDTAASTLPGDSNNMTDGTITPAPAVSSVVCTEARFCLP